MDQNDNAMGESIDEDQDKPFDQAQDKPFEITQDKPFEITQDKQIICAKCNKPFVWTKSEQEYYQKKGLKHEPKLCQDCRKERNNLKPKEITCVSCSRKGHVKGDVPSDTAYCEPCFEEILEKAKKNGEKVEEIK